MSDYDNYADVGELRHVGIVTADIEKSIWFYTEVLGYRVEKDQVESGDFIDNILNLRDIKVRTVKMAKNRSCLIELLYYFSHRRELVLEEVCKIGISHLAFTVRDIDKTCERLSKVGIKPNSPPELSPDGYARLTFCRAPEGTLIELVELL